MQTIVMQLSFHDFLVIPYLSSMEVHPRKYYDGVFCCDGEEKGNEQLLETDKVGEAFS